MTNPNPETDLRDLIAQAIRDAACPGDCGKTEEECAKERIQPFAWHHGRLAVVEGEPEMFADAVLAVLPPAADRAGRAAGLLEAAAFIDNDDDCDCGGCDTCQPRRLAAELRRLAAEQPTNTAGTTADKAAALGMADTEYRARSHAAAVAAVRAAIPGMYAHIGFRLEDVLNEAAEARQQPGIETPASTAPLAAGLPLVKGRCPACGRASLFLGNGGYVTCAVIECAEPDAASTLLDPTEPWLSDSARIGRTLIWSWTDVGKGAFREGYRAAQAEARALLGGERGTDPGRPAVVEQPDTQTREVGL